MVLPWLLTATVASSQCCLLCCCCAVIKLCGRHSQSRDNALALALERSQAALLSCDMLVKWQSCSRILRIFHVLVESVATAMTSQKWHTLTSDKQSFSPSGVVAQVFPVRGVRAHLSEHFQPWEMSCRQWTLRPGRRWKSEQQLPWNVQHRHGMPGAMQSFTTVWCRVCLPSACGIRVSLRWIRWPSSPRSSWPRVPEADKAQLWGAQQLDAENRAATQLANSTFESWGRLERCVQEDEHTKFWDILSIQLSLQIYFDYIIYYIIYITYYIIYIAIYIIVVNIFSIIFLDHFPCLLWFKFQRLSRVEISRPWPLPHSPIAHHPARTVSLTKLVVRVTPRYQIKTCIDCKAHIQTQLIRLTIALWDQDSLLDSQTETGLNQRFRRKWRKHKKAICAGPHWSPSAWAWWSTAESCRARGRGRTWARLSVRHVPRYQSLSSIYFDLEFTVYYFMFVCCYTKLLWLLCQLFIICLYCGVLQNSLCSPRHTAPFGSDGRSWGWPCWWRDLRRGDRRKNVWHRLGVCP